MVRGGSVPIILSLTLAACGSSSVNDDASSGGAGGSSGAASAGAGGIGGGAAGAPTSPHLADCTFLSSDEPKPILYTSLDDAFAVQTPALGASGELSDANATFINGRCDKALSTIGTLAFASYPEDQSLSYAAATISFWIAPDYAHDDGTRHLLAKTSGFGTTVGGMQIVKSGQGDNNRFIVELASDVESYSAVVEPDKYSLAQGIWAHVVVTWDFGSGASDKIRIFFDGIARSDTESGTPLSLTASPNQMLRIGSPDAAAPTEALIDDFKVYASVVSP